MHRGKSKTDMYERDVTTKKKTEDYDNECAKVITKIITYNLFYGFLKI